MSCYAGCKTSCQCPTWRSSILVCSRLTAGEHRHAIVGGHSVQGRSCRQPGRPAPGTGTKIAAAKQCWQPRGLAILVQVSRRAHMTGQALCTMHAWSLHACGGSLVGVTCTFACESSNDVWPMKYGQFHVGLMQHAAGWLRYAEALPSPFHDWRSSGITVPMPPPPRCRPTQLLLSTCAHTLSPRSAGSCCLAPPGPAATSAV